MKENTTLWELWVGSLVLGTVLQLSIVWFLDDKIGFSAGLWLGVIVAWFWAWHMNRSAEKVVNGAAENADKYMRFSILIRFFVAAVAMTFAVFIDWLNPICVFMGIMTLKIAAYIQPLTHKIMKRFRRND